MPIGGNCRTVHAALRRPCLDTVHWTGGAWNRGRRGDVSAIRRPLSDILREGTVFAASKLHVRLLSEGIFARRWA